ncbi:hypothetical protein EI555_001378 [Monodon monoceros]|uniref:Thyroglobulin type-1 domain-containing protein n=1 Tax=Monodon monoceros TaxID=40151 RepID=A0A4V5PAF4_MONMO|nr:hypothetical protein EI555_001378 [Monodon monoceros]
MLLRPGQSEKVLEGGGSFGLESCDDIVHSTCLSKQAVFVLLPFALVLAPLCFLTRTPEGIGSCAVATFWKFACQQPWTQTSGGAVRTPPGPRERCGSLDSCPPMGPSSPCGFISASASRGQGEDGDPRAVNGDFTEGTLGQGLRAHTTPAALGPGTEFLRVDQDKDKDCSLDCGGPTQKPLCASDGRTFLSRCEFQRAKCKDPRLEIAYRGNCKATLYPPRLVHQRSCGKHSVASVSLPCEDVSRCVAERKYTQEQARKELQQVFVPECSDDGTYSQVQCHSYTGYCWCVTPNGRPISGTAVAHKTPRCPGSINEKLPQREGTGKTVSSCDQEQQSALEEARQPKNDNVVIPECAHGGLYKPVQCHPSTGYCWCVLVDTGRPIPGTSTRYEQPKCDNTARAHPTKTRDLYKGRQLQGTCGSTRFHLTKTPGPFGTFRVDTYGTTDFSPKRNDAAFE